MITLNSSDGEFVFDRQEYIMGNGEKVICRAFSPFPTLFSIAFSPQSSENRIAWITLSQASLCLSAVQVF